MSDPSSTRGPAFRRRAVAGGVALAVVGLGALSAWSLTRPRPKRYITTVEVLQTQVFGSNPASPAVMDLDLWFVDCPGRQRKIVRGDRAFATCARSFVKGDRVPVELLSAYRDDRGGYRSEIVKVGDCERAVEAKDDASYEIVQHCKDVVLNGVVVGVRCDRTRSAEFIAACPWFRRR